MWRGANYPGEFPSLGWQIVDWCEELLVNPDGEHRGEPWRFTDEQIRFIVRLYRIDPETGQLAYRRGVLVRPKGWGKSPVLATLAIANAAGPVMFGGWDAEGEPVAVPRATPYVQLAAVSEDQTDNTYSLLLDMLELGDVASAAPGMDAGLTRIYFPHNGGKIEPVTASAGAREGQRITFAVLDETHLWMPNNGGVKLAAVLRRNLAKMGGLSCETTNAPALGLGSVAEKTLEAHREGKRSEGIFVDIREPSIHVEDLSKTVILKKALRDVYGDAKWIDLDRIVAEIHDPDTDPADARRFYLNTASAQDDAAFDPVRWRELVRSDFVVPAKELVTLGFDGARFFDSTALVATHVPTGHQWPLAIWESDPDDPDWEVDETLADAAVDDAFSTWRVLRFYADPPYWESAVARWAGKYGSKTCKVLEWWTNRDRQAAYMSRAYRGAMNAGDISHSGDEVFTRHIENTRKRVARIKDDEGKPLWLMTKPGRKTRRFIDSAMAGALSWQARLDAIAAGEDRVKTYRAYSA